MKRLEPSVPTPESAGVGARWSVIGLGSSSLLESIATMMRCRGGLSGNIFSAIVDDLVLGFLLGEGVDGGGGSKKV